MPSFWKKPSDEGATGDAEVILKVSRYDLTGVLNGGLHTRQEILVAASATTAFAGGSSGGDASSGRDRVVPAPLPQLERTVV